MITSKIYSKQFQTYKPVTVKKEIKYMVDTKYTVFDGNFPIGYVQLEDTTNGVYVLLIENQHSELYSGFGKIADQIEVEHCLNRGLRNFSINSDAVNNSHALHYKRGKRFSEVKKLEQREKLMQMFNTTDVNKIVKTIIKITKPGQQYITNFLGFVPMYMPQNIIQKYIQAIKKRPLLK